MSRETEHTCHARGCDRHVPPRIFMCRSHWFSLPRPLRAALSSAYVPGQEGRMDPTDEYLEAAMACVDYIAQQEASA